MTPPTKAVVEFDAFEPQHHADPYPSYARVREATPACPLLLGDVPVTVFTRYEECAAVLQSPDWGHGYAAGISPFREQGALIPGSFVRMDPPDHTRFRALVNKAFTPRTVAALTPLVERVVDELLDTALEQARSTGRLDVINDLAVPLALAMIGGRVLGVPEADRPVLREWELAIARGTDPDELLPPEAVVARGLAARECAGYFQRLVARRRTDPADDLLSELIRVEERGDTLTEPELVGICLLLLVAGMETSINLVGNAVLALLRHPEQQALLRARPELMASTIDEALRYDAPTQFTIRVALTDTEVAGHSFARGDGVVVVTASAGRDGAVYADPDRFDITRFHGPRPARRHLGFSLGLHFCVGAPLARVEADAAIGGLLRRVPGLALTQEVLPEYLPSLIHRGLRALPVVVDG
ncbi:cytochrome P450 [Pseudonocardia xinjiangensis]|uniref:Cytochrome P450 n=1 Tax=Pseudonocardia xinjiangensis TaxID=75289 RepID=A0ABX1R852_9PSEU|nr:cytochrome P450 [Pseudonocardia xinjiangensis]NMH75839.1 cytochrome P450 [Pseudonocardia xinjiangensis]